MTRNGFVLMVFTIVLVDVARTGIVRLWAHKALATTTPGSPANTAAEVLEIIT
jgi:hypothetical protein